MIAVLRLDHRVVRDQRVTTHVALTARAFGADSIMISGEKDGGIIGSVDRVVDEFGGEFSAEFVKSWKKVIGEWKGVIIHLTMYGVDVDEVKDEIARVCAGKDVLIVVGGAKVPPEVYEKAHYNVAIGNQPHSEVAAVALLLDRIVGVRGIRGRFAGALKRVRPNPKGKTVEKL